MPPDGRPGAADAADATPAERIALGPAADISDRECAAAAGGRAIIVRTGDRIVAYRNRCLHQDSPLAGGWVRDGVLTCPLHFWRYRVDDGCPVGSDAGAAALESFPVEIVDGDAYVTVPAEPEPPSIRDVLLARARGYERAEEFERRRGRATD